MSDALAELRRRLRESTFYEPVEPVDRLMDALVLWVAEHVDGIQHLSRVAPLDGYFGARVNTGGSDVVALDLAFVEAFVKSYGANPEETLERWKGCGWVHDVREIRIADEPRPCWCIHVHVLTGDHRRRQSIVG
jgi:hypothetical protein